MRRHGTSGHRPSPNRNWEGPRPFPQGAGLDPLGLMAGRSITLPPPKTAAGAIGSCNKIVSTDSDKFPAVGNLELGPVPKGRKVAPCATGWVACHAPPERWRDSFVAVSSRSIARSVVVPSRWISTMPAAALVTLLERQPMLLALRAWRCLIGGFVQGADVDQQAHCACDQDIRQEIYGTLSPFRYQAWIVRPILGRIDSSVAHPQAPRRRRRSLMAE